MKTEPKVTIVTAKNGKKYAYETSGHTWDKGKKQCRTKLRYYGTVDEDGVVHPKKSRLVKAAVAEKQDATLSLQSTIHVGLTRVLSSMADDIHLRETLKKTFPETWSSILSLAMYHVSTGSNAAYLFPEWADENETPLHGEALTSESISRLYGEMDEARRKQFLLEWRKATATGEACFHDITSISSYSLKSDVVEYGYNRDKEDLPQINLGMVTDSGNRLPLYYRIHDGSISDVATLKHVLHEGYAFNMNKLTFVMDKGFFSTQNIGMMYSYGYHFIISMTFATKAAGVAVDEVRNTIHHPRNLIRTANGEYLYARAIEDHWNAADLHRDCKIHVYTRMTSDIQVRSGNLDLRLVDCLNELNDGKFIPSHASLYARYFTETTNPDGSKTYNYNDEAIASSENKYSGYLCIITDRTKLTSAEVIDIYRDKDGVEKVFDDIKNIQDCKRLNVQSRPAMEGKMLVIFIAAILISEIRRRMKLNYKGKDNWTMDLIRRKLNKIQISSVKTSYFRTPKKLLSIISLSQRQILSALLKAKEKEVEATLKSIIV